MRSKPHLFTGWWGSSTNEAAINWASDFNLIFFFKYNGSNWTFELQRKWLSLCWSSYIQGFSEKVDMTAHTTMTGIICVSGVAPERSNHLAGFSPDLWWHQIKTAVKSHHIKNDLKRQKILSSARLRFVITRRIKCQLICDATPL